MKSFQVLGQWYCLCVDVKEWSGVIFTDDGQQAADLVVGILLNQSDECGTRRQCVHWNYFPWSL